MSHQVEIVEIKELNDSEVSYRVRCCGEEMTDSWHTVHVSAPDHDEQLAAHKQRVADLHEAKLQWRQKYGTSQTQG